MTEPNQDLASLAQDPRWKELGRVMDERMDREFTSLAHKFAKLNEQPDYAQLQWVRGVMAGMKFLYRQPTLNADALSKLLAQERGESE